MYSHRCIQLNVGGNMQRRNSLAAMLIMLIVCLICLISILFILIIERKPHVWILRTMGASDGLIRRIFVKQTLLVLGKGMLWGNAVALWVQPQVIGKVKNGRPAPRNARPAVRIETPAFSATSFSVAAMKTPSPIIVPSLAFYYSIHLWK